MKEVRYIREWNDGNTDNEHLAHWIELQAYSNGINVALNKPIKCNFLPNQDVSGQSLPPTIVNGQISIENYVSVSLDLQRERPAMVLIDLQQIYPLDEIHIWHGWWAQNRSYFTILEISTDLENWKTIYDFRSMPKIIETQNGKGFKL